MVEYDPVHHQMMAMFAIGLGIESLVFIILKVDIEAWMYGYIALLAIIFGFIALTPPTLFYTVKVKEEKLSELDLALKELQEKAVIVEKVEEKKPENRIEQLIQELLVGQKGER